MYFRRRRPVLTVQCKFEEIEQELADLIVYEIDADQRHRYQGGK